MLWTLTAACVARPCICRGAWHRGRGALTCCAVGFAQHLKSIDPTTGNVTKEFELKNITEITRVASNDRRLRLKFDWATQRDYLVQFETCNARESFCALLAVMHRPVLSMDEGEVDLSDFAVAGRVICLTASKNLSSFCASLVRGGVLLL